MGITNADVKRFTDMAGPDFMWASVKGCHRPGSDVRTMLRSWLAQAQDWTCVQCGESLKGGSFEFCHVVSRGPKVKGFVPGNVFAGHAACNASTKPIHAADGSILSGVAVLSADMLARPDLMVMDWPAMSYFRSLARA